MAAGTIGSKILRWLKRIGIGIVALFVILLITGTIYEQLARHRATRDYPPRGQMVDIGGRKMHIDCRGSGSPTVIFEAGLDSTGSLTWDRVQDTIAKTTRACSYDRAGVMWSDPTPGDQDGEKVADDLHATLKGAGITGPLVMVGHSLGGPYIMNYVRKYGDPVKGMVFVDTSHPDQIERMKNEKLEKASEGNWFLDLLLASSWTGIVRALEPEATTPGIPDRTKTVGGAYGPQTIAGSMKEARSLGRILEQGGKLRALGDRPLVVLTATQPYPDETLKALGMTRQDADKMQATWRQLHVEEASWSTRSRQELVPDSGHFIQYQRPDLVIKAVKEVVDTVRADEAGAKP